MTHYDNKIYREKKVSLWLLGGVLHSVIMADFIMQQPIVVIIYSPYLLNDPVEH